MSIQYDPVIQLPPLTSLFDATLIYSNPWKTCQHYWQKVVELTLKAKATYQSMPAAPKDETILMSWNKLLSSQPISSPP